MIPTVRRFTALAAVAGVLSLAGVVGFLSCTSPPQRKVARLDPELPVGRIEGQVFHGVQIPLTISTAGTGWEISTEFPRFLLEQGYEEAGLKQSQVFAYNPKTRSSLQIELSPAGPRDTFSQEGLEWLAGIMTGGMEDELEHEYGAGNFRAVHGKAEPYRLEGVPYAAHNFTSYEAKGDTRKNGWIYAFAEPFQIFILYQINDTDPGGDEGAVHKILSTFRYVEPPAPR